MGVDSYKNNSNLPICDPGLLVPFAHALAVVSATPAVVFWSGSANDRTIYFLKQRLSGMYETGPSEIFFAPK
jgi:hypothetical protein